MPCQNLSAVMFRNRISRFTVEAPVAEERAQTGFAPLPAFAMSGSSTLDVYRLAYEQAKLQVAERHERRCRAHEWN